MVNHQVNSFWDAEISQPGHQALLVRSSGDGGKEVLVRCVGTDGQPYDVEEGVTEDACGWHGPRFRAGRWQAKHVGEAFAQHVVQVAEHGPIEHGRAGNCPDVCRCSWCRLVIRPGSTVANAPEASQ